MIYLTLVFTVFMLVVNLLGGSDIGSASWASGVVAGAALALVWHANKSVSKVLGIVGICLLSATALGLGEDLTADARGFFNGMTLGMFIGFALSAWMRWKTLKPKVVMVAKMENVQWLLRMLGER